ncbi:serine/threonine-protein kinase TTK/MPS1 [Nematocida sp. AWRm77]|nr:serine/threonine-protein kinase TTK/MPS1 [Nematocida sp. AWRm77]
MERLFRIEDILQYIEEQKNNNASLTRQLSMYYEATQKNLGVTSKTLCLWKGYIDLLEKNGYAYAEIREVYKMLKSTYWKFLSFWDSWFEYESRLSFEESKKAKVLEMAHDILQFKECQEKKDILQWVRERAVGPRGSTDTREPVREPVQDSFREPVWEPVQEPVREAKDMTSGIVYPDTPRSLAVNTASMYASLGTMTIGGGIFDALPNAAYLKGPPTEEFLPSAAPQETSLIQSAQGASSSVYKKITLNGKKLKILRTIGKGGSGKVYQVLSDKNEVFALKKIKIPPGKENEELHRSYVNEIDLLKRLKHRHEIVTLKDSYINKDRIAILMEYGDIDLCKFLDIERMRTKGHGYRKSPENYTMVALWEQMLRAVKCIHDHRIVHRDLKPANFLFVGGRLKLIDFGISKEIRNDTTNIIREKQIGTINYMSPEAIIEGKAKIGRSSDIWSLGCILYEMYFGESPFMRFKNLVQRMQKLLDPAYTVEYPEEDPEDTRHAEIVQEIQRCLVREPKQRARIDTLLEEGVCSRKKRASALCVFSREDLHKFISKIMDMKHLAPTGEGRDKIIEKISSLYIREKDPLG